MWDTVQQLVRIVMQFLGGYLVSKGILTEEVAAQLSGAILSIAAVAWWLFWDKSKVHIPSTKV